MNLASTRLPELVQVLHSSLVDEPVVARGKRWIVVEYHGWMFCHATAPVGVEGPFPDMYAVVTERGRPVKESADEWVWDGVRWRVEQLQRHVVRVGRV